MQMNENYLKSRKHFSKACTSYVKQKGWLDPIENRQIDSETQTALLEGFRKFYDKRHRKYEKIEKAKGITFVRTVRKSWSFAVINEDDTLTTVSKNCKRLRLVDDIYTACRGVLYSKRIKYERRTFWKTFRKWLKTQDVTELYTNVIHNDPQNHATAKKGWKSLEEPYFTLWVDFYQEMK